MLEQLTDYEVADDGEDDPTLLLRSDGSVVDTWREEQPMHDWLDVQVGPSELPPPDAEW